MKAHLDVRLNLRPQLLQVLHDGAVNGTAQVRVLVGNRTRLVADAIEYVLIPRTHLSYLIAKNRGC